VVTSYFGLISETAGALSRAHRQIPQGNAIVIPMVRATFRRAEPARRERPNRGHAHQPNDPYNKILVVAAPTPTRRWRRRRPWLCTATCSTAADRHSDAQAAGQAATRRRAALGADDQRMRCGTTPTPTRCRATARRPQRLLPHRAGHLLHGREPNAKLNLVYRYNSIHRPISSMQVRINNAFLGSVPLVPGRRSEEDGGRCAGPVVNLRPFSNSLSFDFTFQLLKRAAAGHTRSICRRPFCAIPTSICAAIPLRAAAHLELFANAVSRSRGSPTWRDHRGVAAHAHRAGDRDIRHAHGALQPPDRLPGPARHGRRSRRPATRSEKRFPDYRHRRRPAGFEKLNNTMPVALRSASSGARHAGFLRSVARSSVVEARKQEHTESGDLTAANPGYGYRGIKSPTTPQRSQHRGHSTSATPAPLNS